MSHSQNLVRWLAETGIRGDPVSLSDLAAVPTCVSVEGVSLAIEAYLWRDFQPISPPNGQPLIALVRVRPLGSVALPADLSAERIAIIHEQMAWVARPVKERPANVDVPFEVVARNGPKWGPGVSVEVILQLSDAEGGTCLLRVSNQLIERED